MGNKGKSLFVCAKRTIKNFDEVKVVLPVIFMSLGYTIVTLRSETLLYINTSYCVVATMEPNTCYRRTIAYCGRME